VGLICEKGGHTVFCPTIRLCVCWPFTRVSSYLRLPRPRDLDSAQLHHFVADLLRRLARTIYRPRPTTILCEPDEHTILPMLKLTKNIPCRDEGDCGLAPKAVSSNTLPFAP
jgi:hypothetical protein